MHPRIVPRCVFGITLGMLAATPAAALAAVPPAYAPQAVTPLVEMPDPELAALRGRFIIGNHAVAYFGVSMLSSWNSPDGMQMQGGATLGMHFGSPAQAPRVSFTPTLTIVRGVPSAPAAGDVTRSVDAAGLANVSGLLQGIQVAGNANRARNSATINISAAAAGATAATLSPVAAPFAGSTRAGDAAITLTFDPARGVSLELGVAGQGLVSQWIRAGSVGQQVQLTADGQSVANVLQLNLALNQAPAQTPAAYDVARALLQARANSTGG